MTLLFIEGKSFKGWYILLHFSLTFCRVLMFGLQLVLVSDLGSNNAADWALILQTLYGGFLVAGTYL